MKEDEAHPSQEGEIVSVRRDPVAQRWLLGGEVAMIRKRSGHSLADVAESTRISKPKLGELERGTYNVEPDELEIILRACLATGEDIARLRSFATKPRGKPWWSAWDAVVSEWFGLFLGLEGLADSLTAYEMSAVPGPLQTPDYARAITNVASMVRSSDIDRHVELRMERAARLDAEPLLDYRVVVEEAALRRMPRDHTVMKAEIAHLISMSERPNVEIRVMPVDRVLHAGMTVPQYVLFGFIGMGSVAYTEGFGDAMYIRDPDRLRSYLEAAKHLSEAALSPEATRDLLTQMRRSL